MKFFSRMGKLKYPIIADKRQRFAIQVLILTSGLVITQLAWEDVRFYMVGALAAMTYLLTAWSLYEDIKGFEWILLFILPVLYTITFSLFYFLLPERWISRLLVTLVFAIGMYACLLLENIYNVAVERSIQLLRAAHSVGFLTSLVVLFLGTTIIFSLRLSYFQNVILLFPLVFLLSLQSLWSIKLEAKISKNIILYTLLVSLGIGEIGLSLSFWPAQITTIALFISAVFYALVSICQLHLSERLFKNSLREYIIVFIFSIIITIISSRWG